MKLSKRRLAILAMIAGAIIWGAAIPIFKWSMQEIPPFTLATLRFSLAALIILPFAYKKIEIKNTDVLKLLFLGFIGITLHIGLFFVGLRLTSSINVPILNSITPILLILGSVWYLREKLKMKVVLGTIISMIGILLIVIEPLLVTGPDGSILGNIFIILSILCVIIYTLLLKKFAFPYPSITIVFWTLLFGAFLFLPAFFVEAVTLHPFTHMDTKAFIGIFYGAVFSSALAYFFYNFSLEHLKANEIGIFTYIEPFITILIAIPLLGEKIYPVYVIGGLIVFLGICVAETRLHYHPHHLLSKKPN